MLVSNYKNTLGSRHRDQPPTAARYPRGHRKGMADMNGGNGTKVLVRSRKGRMLAGVCAADYFGLDVTLVRVIVAFVSVRAARQSGDHQQYFASDPRAGSVVLFHRGVPQAVRPPC